MSTIKLCSKRKKYIDCIYPFGRKAVVSLELQTRCACARRIAYPRAPAVLPCRHNRDSCQLSIQHQASVRLVVRSPRSCFPTPNWNCYIHKHSTITCLFPYTALLLLSVKRSTCVIRSSATAPSPVYTRIKRNGRQTYSPSALRIM